MASSPASTTMPSNNSSLSVNGQRHDRFDHHGVVLGEPDEDDQDISISLGQKMLSAVSGSLITSFLGMKSRFPDLSPLLTKSPVTPLDVVRVRLQSEQPHAPSFRPTSSSLPQAYSFTNLPPNLGISACCREVFWVSNNTSYCVASPSIPIAPSAVNKSAAACAAEEAQRKTFTSTFDGMRKIARNEGLRTLWRGLSPTLVMAIPANVIYFAGYDWLRYNRKSPFRQTWIDENYIPLIAGSSARIIAAIAVSPIEMFRTRMQAARNSGGGTMLKTLQDLREIVGVKGYRSLWAGLGLTLWRDVPFSAIYWWGYELGRNALHEYRTRGTVTVFSGGAERSRRPSVSRENHTTTLIDSFVAGASSGAVAALVTTPFDVGKTRQQVVRYGAAASTVSTAAAKLPEELSMPQFLWHIFKTQGMSGLFKGWAARCMKVAPACAIMISSYEIGKKMAGGMTKT
jgi:solute carrier family 25, member 39/40